MICVERNVIPYETQLVFMEFKIMNPRLCYSYYGNGAVGFIHLEARVVWYRI